MIKIKNILLGLLLLLCSGHGFAQDVNGFLRQNGTEIVNDNGAFILRGIGPGGWMLQEGYMFGPINVGGTQFEIRATLEELTDKETTDAFYEDWLAYYFTREDVDSVASWGYNSIRVPLHYNLFTLPIEDETNAGDITWLTKGFEMLDSLLAQCEDNDLYLILDMHAAPGGQGKNAEISDYDPTKPSLWESELNKDKFVALWYELAKRYKDNPYIGAYDLLNETNWWDDFENNQPLVDLYKRTMDTIRTVDTNHLIVLEGNSWANDYNGFEGIHTHDDNIAFGPHKYWTVNDQGAKDWLNGLRNDYHVPVWLGETGENSNTWLTDLIILLEDINVGWATWAHKQMDIDDAYTITCESWKNTIVKYMNEGSPKPSQVEMTAAMEDMIEAIKTENCTYNHGVVFAQTELPYGAQRKAFKEHNLPGKIYTTDYDHGRYFDAWYDKVYQNLNGSTGEYTAPNSGYMYRNDGVDIDVCSDYTSNGYAIGWTEKGEWLKYTLNEVAGGVYDIDFHVAGEGGKLKVNLDNTTVGVVDIPNTGGYHNYRSVKLLDVSIPAGTKELMLYVEEAGFNFNQANFIMKTSGMESAESSKKKSIEISTHSHASQLNIELKNTSDTPVRIDSVAIYDYSGHKMEEVPSFNIYNQHSLSLTKEYQQGAYIIQVVTEHDIITYKILI